MKQHWTKLWFEDRYRSNSYYDWVCDIHQSQLWHQDYVHPLPGSLPHLGQLLICIKVESILFSYRCILGHILSCMLLTILRISWVKRISSWSQVVQSFSYVSIYMEFLINFLSFWCADFFPLSLLYKLPSCYFPLLQSQLAIFRCSHIKYPMSNFSPLLWQRLSSSTSPRMVA